MRSRSLEMKVWVVSQGSGGFGGVPGQGPSTVIKAKHGCLAKIDTSSQFGSSAGQPGGGGGG